MAFFLVDFTGCFFAAFFRDLFFALFVVCVGSTLLESGVKFLAPFGEWSGFFGIAN